MSRLNLLGGTYLARSIIADAQTCFNLFPEKNPQDASAPYTHYLTPGTVLKKIAPVAGAARGLYTATTGSLYYVCGNEVIFVDSTFTLTVLGNLGDNLTTPIAMQDNGNVLVITNGLRGKGWAINLESGVSDPVNAFAAIIDPNFLGSVGIGYVDTFLGFNEPGTRNFYTSLSNITYAELVDNPGQILTGAIQSGGTGGTDATYPNVPLTGGNGTGAIATLTVTGGAVTTVDFSGAGNSSGLGYQEGDILGAAHTGVPSAFAFEVLTANPVAFDPTFLAAKTGYPDLLATIVAVHREWWLMGSFESTEVWYDAGGATFPFAIMPGVFIQHGCAAPASVQTHDLVTFWLGIDNAGIGTVFMGSGYAARRISTFAIERIIAKIVKSGATINDAIGMIYKIEDHVFYVLTFPAGDKTIVYDLTEGLWHEWGWTDPATGIDHRHRAGAMALAYNVNVAADWENGNLYVLDLYTATDNGNVIVRRRAFPHLLNDGKRATYDRLALDMECGNGLPSDPTYVPLVTLEISDDRGRTFRALPMQSLGKTGEYLVQPVWHRMGLARDRVFRVTWSEAVFTSLQGAWLDVTPSET